MLYYSVLSTVTHVIEPSWVSLYAIVTVRMIPREEYGIPEPLLLLEDFDAFPFLYSYRLIILFFFSYKV